VLAEAMMCGCPVVTVSQPTRDNSQVEVVGHEQGGLVAGSFGQLGNALARLWEDAALRRRLAAGCRQRILEICETKRLVARALRAAESGTEFITRVSDEEICSLATNVLGEPRDLRWMKLANSGIEHRLRQLARRVRRR
jgi:hypothetical protein